MAQRQLKKGEFQNGLFGCCSSGEMWMGCCCPCVLVNKTQVLIKREDDKHFEPKDPSGCGAWGCAWCFLNMAGGWGGILGCLQREKIRNLDGNKIDGGCCGDFCSNFCCPCCAVIQQYKEVESRRDRNKINRGGYKPQPGMHS